MTFLKTNEGQQIIWLDHIGYHLQDNQNDLTIIQAFLLYKGSIDLHNKMNSDEK